MARDGDTHTPSRAGQDGFPWHAVTPRPVSLDSLGIEAHRTRSSPVRHAASGSPKARLVSNRQGRGLQTAHTWAAQSARSQGDLRLPASSALCPEGPLRDRHTPHPRGRRFSSQQFSDGVSAGQVGRSRKGVKRSQQVSDSSGSGLHGGSLRLEREAARSCPLRNAGRAPAARRASAMDRERPRVAGRLKAVSRGACCPLSTRAGTALCVHAWGG